MKPWTLFWDMHSGGGCKESPYEMIYIQAPEEEAAIIFYNRFGHNPYRISCTCCGQDYSVSESPTIEAVSGYHRGCEWVNDQSKKGGGYYVEKPSTRGYGKSDYKTVEQYSKEKDVLMIPDHDIKPEERVGDLPQQGYVWQD